MLKSMVSDLEWFDSDWWREIQLLLKNNRVIVMNNKITVVLA